MLAQDPDKLPDTSEAALALIGSKFPDQSTGRAVSQFFVRLKRAYSDCCSALGRPRCRRLLPHPDTLVKLVYVFQRASCRVEYSTEVQDILMIRRSSHTEADLDLDLVCAACSQAAARVVKTFPALEAAIVDALEARQTHTGGLGAHNLKPGE